MISRGEWGLRFLSTCCSEGLGREGRWEDRWYRRRGRGWWRGRRGSSRSRRLCRVAFKVLLDVLISKQVPHPSRDSCHNLGRHPLEEPPHSLLFCYQLCHGPPTFFQLLRLFLMDTIQQLQPHADHIKGGWDDQGQDRGVQGRESDDEIVVLGEAIVGIEGVCFALTEVVLFFCGEVVEKNFFGGFVAGPVSNAGGCEGKEGRHEALVVSTYTVRPVDRLEDVYLEEAALQQFICQFFFPGTVSHQNKQKASLEMLSHSFPLLFCKVIHVNYLGWSCGDPLLIPIGYATAGRWYLWGHTESLRRPLPKILPYRPQRPLIVVRN